MKGHKMFAMTVTGAITFVVLLAILLFIEDRQFAKTHSDAGTKL